MTRPDIEQRMTERAQEGDDHLSPTALWLQPEDVALLREAAEEIRRLREALHDAIRAPMGVVPDSALPFYQTKPKPARPPRKHPDCEAGMCGVHDCGRDGPCYADTRAALNPTESHE